LSSPPHTLLSLPTRRSSDLVGTELQHAAGHVNCAFDLAAGSQLRRVTNVDNDNIALAHPVSEIGGLNPRHGGIGTGQHILHTRRHGFTPVFPRKLWGGSPFLVRLRHFPRPA